MRRPLRVLLNDRPLTRTLTGVGNYIAQVLTHVPRVTAAVSLRPFCLGYLRRQSWPAQSVAANPSPAVPLAPGPERHPRDLSGGRWPWWARRTLQGGYRQLFRLAGLRNDLYHEPNHIPLRCGLRTVTTIHDLSVLVHPEWHPADRVRWYEEEFAAGLRQSRVLIAVSEYTKRDLVARLGVTPERVFVTYQAPRAAFRPRPAQEVAALRAQMALPERFFLYVGTLEPRKNLTGLLEAYAALPMGIRQRHPLLLAGAWGWKQEALRELLQRLALGDQVRTLGYLGDDSLAALYAACTAFVWPTLFEGFGLPPLEALACGAPVIVSNTTSLPEVVGDAGCLLAPRDQAGWTDAMRRAAEDGAWRATMAAAGPVQAGRFTWDAFAEQTIRAYEAAAAD